MEIINTRILTIDPTAELDVANENCNYASGFGVRTDRLLEDALEVFISKGKELPCLENNTITDDVDIREWTEDFGCDVCVTSTDEAVIAYIPDVSPFTVITEDERKAAFDDLVRCCEKIIFTNHLHQSMFHRECRQIFDVAAWVANNGGQFHLTFE